MGQTLTVKASVLTVPQPFTLASTPLALILSLDAPAFCRLSGSGCDNGGGQHCTVAS